jgi:hypothetical protein
MTVSPEKLGHEPFRTAGKNLSCRWRAILGISNENVTNAVFSETRVVPIHMNGTQ